MNWHEVVIKLIRRKGSHQTQLGPAPSLLLKLFELAKSETTNEILHASKMKTGTEDTNISASFYPHIKKCVPQYSVIATESPILL